MNISISIQRDLAKAEKYNKAVLDNFKGFIGNNILEVGCSIGNITKLLLNKKHVVGIDILPDAVSIIKKRYAQKNLKTFVFDISDKKCLQLKKYEFDTILCLNVLEHIKDDAAALKNMHDLLDNGNLLLLVPAHRWLYGSVDAADGHYRRYTKRELCCKVQKAGFKIKRINYFNMLGIPGWYLNGRIFRKEQNDSKLLSVFNMICPYVFKLETLMGNPYGQSLICICTK